METLLRKYLWAVDLAVIALCAVFGARATATAIEAGFVSGIAAARHARRAAAGAGLDHRLHEAGRGDPQAEHLLLDLPADPRAEGRDGRHAGGRRRCRRRRCR